MWDSAKFYNRATKWYKDYFLGTDFKDHKQSKDFFFPYFYLPSQVSYEEQL